MGLYTFTESNTFYNAFTELTLGDLIGIIVGCVVFILLIVGIVVFMIVHNRKEIQFSSIIRDLSSNEKGTNTEHVDQDGISKLTHEEDDRLL